MTGKPSIRTPAKCDRCLEALKLLTQLSRHRISAVDVVDWLNQQPEYLDGTRRTKWLSEPPPESRS